MNRHLVTFVLFSLLASTAFANDPEQATGSSFCHQLVGHWQGQDRLHSDNPIELNVVDRSKSNGPTKLFSYMSLFNQSGDIADILLFDLSCSQSSNHVSITMGHAQVHHDSPIDYILDKLKTANTVFALPFELGSLFTKESRVVNNSVYDRRRVFFQSWFTRSSIETRISIDSDAGLNYQLWERTPLGKRLPMKDINFERVN